MLKWKLSQQAHTYTHYNILYIQTCRIEEREKNANIDSWPEATIKSRAISEQYQNMAQFHVAIST